MTSDPGQLEQLLRGFRRTAFRLEALDRYAADYEEERFARYLAGEPLPPPDPVFEDWWEYLRSLPSVGKEMARVHAIAGSLTPYVRFEIEWGYVYSAAAGERIHILHHPDLREVFGAVTPPDFWLFDDETVAEMHYDGEGRWLGLTLVTDPEAVAPYRALRESAMRHAVSLDHYLATLRRLPVDPPASSAVERIAS